MVVTSMACNGRLIGMPAGDDSGLPREGTDAGQGYNRMVILRQKAGGRRQKAEGRRQEAEGRRQKAEADLIRDRIRRFKLPGKHMVGVAFSRDICNGCCIRLPATPHIKSGDVRRSGSYPRQNQKIQFTWQAQCGSGFQPRYLHALHSCLPVLPEGSNVNAK